MPKTKVENENLPSIEMELKTLLIYIDVKECLDIGTILRNKFVSESCKFIRCMIYTGWSVNWRRNGRACYAWGCWIDLENGRRKMFRIKVIKVWLLPYDNNNGWEKCSNSTKKGMFRHFRCAFKPKIFLGWYKLDFSTYSANCCFASVIFAHNEFA